MANKAFLDTDNEKTLRLSLTEGSTTPTPATGVTDQDVTKLANVVGFSASKDFPNTNPGEWTLALWPGAEGRRIDPIGRCVCGLPLYGAEAHVKK
jgi:hypothetical protein